MAAGYILTEARYDRVLAWINKVRAEHKIGKPLKRIPRGYRMNPSRCPIACSLTGGPFGEVGVDSTDVSLYPAHRVGATVSIKPPNYIAAFINAFDEGACTRLRKLAKA